MNVSWTNALSLWWSFTWRMTVFAVLWSVAFGFVVSLIAGAQPVLCYFVGLLVWFPVSVFTMKLAVGRYVGQPQSWRGSIAYWWSLMWRLTLYALLVGFILSVLVSALVGRPSEHPGFVFFGWFIIFGPMEVVTFRQVVAVHSLSVAPKIGST
jgi:hypothetical protein